MIDGQIVPAETFYTLNVEDIKKVKVLKDAAANAMYGIKAANGVIEITLKKGYNGPVQISANYQTGITLKGSQKYEMMNSSEKLEYERLMSNKDLPGYRYSKDYIDLKYSSNPTLHKQKLAEGKHILDSLRKINTDWYDKLIQRSIYHRYNISARGGDKTKSFYLSLGYYSQGGKMEGNDKNSLSLHGNYGYSINEDIYMGISTSVNHTTFTNNSASTTTSPRRSTVDYVNSLISADYLVYRLNPYETTYSKRLTSMGGKNFQSLINKFDKNNTYKRFSFSGVLNYNILEGLRLDASNGINFNYRNDIERMSPDSPAARGDKGKKGKHTELNSEKIIYTSNIRVNYSKKYYE